MKTYTQKQKKILPLETLRGIAASLIVLFHFNYNTHLNTSVSEDFWLMVDFFFVLSGFVIALNYFGKISNFSDFSRFIKRRFLRLYPLHLLMLILFLLIEIGKFLVSNYLNITPNSGIFVQNDLTAFIANLFLIQNWVLPEVTFNYQSWSISSEFYVYAIFGILLINFKHRLFLILLMLFMIFCSFLVIFNIGMHTDNISGPARCIYSFFLGVISYKIFDKYSLRDKIKNSWISLGMLILSIFVLTINNKSAQGLTALIPLIFSLLILAISSTNASTSIYRILSWRRLVYLGTISYGIYMIHPFILWVSNQILRFIFNFPTVTNIYNEVKISITNPFLGDFLMVLIFTTVIFFAHLSNKYFESFFMSNKKLEKY